MGNQASQPSGALRLRADSRKRAPTLDIEASVAVPSPLNDIAHCLAVSRSVTDKFLVRCLLDSDVRSIFERPPEKLLNLKGHIVETLVATLRTPERFDEEAKGDSAAPMSLQVHADLTETRLTKLRQHFEEAVREHSSTGVGDQRAVLASTKQLLEAKQLPLALLPQEESAEPASRAAALLRRGAEEHVQRLGPWELPTGLLNVPMKRQRQAICCALVSSAIPELLIVYFLLCRYRRRLWPLLLAYLPMALFDRAAWKGGRRPSQRLRGAAVFKHFANYFPASLIKSQPQANFDGQRPVLMGYHPHGILSFGALINYGTDATGWKEKFPNLTPRLATLNMNFQVPIVKDILTRLGMIAASNEGIKNALVPGNAVVVVVGGAAEALDTKPGEYVLTLQRRSGFFRLALQQGADLVPTFGFGENDIFDTVIVEGSMLRRLQLRMYKLLSFSTPVFYGRSLITYNMGTLPYRRPLTVVVGEPLRVEQVEKPTKEHIEAVKARYIQALRELYLTWQPRLEPGREKALVVL